MTTPLFDERKTAQAAAYLLHRAGGALELLKLMKLMYLAERTSLARFGEPITGDALFAMPHGPVLSTTLDFANGFEKSSKDGWDLWMADRAGRQISLRDPSALKNPEHDLLQLSTSDMDVLAEVWDEFGHLSAWQLRQYTHDHLPEWQDPDGGHIPISYKDLFQALGFEPAQVEAMAGHLRDQEKIVSALAAH